MGNIYTVTITAVAVAVAQDLYEIVPPTSSRIRIREIRLGQYSDAGDAAAEILSLQVIRGHRTGGSNAGPAAATPRNIHGHTGALADTGTLVRINDTGLASDTGSKQQTIISDTWNIQAGWWYYPPEEEMLVLETGQRLVVRLAAAPTDSITINGTLTYEKIGLGGLS